jgi:hypothetical protein
MPKILSPAEIDALLGALPTARDRAMVFHRPVWSLGSRRAAQAGE